MDTLPLFRHTCSIGNWYSVILITPTTMGRTTLLFSLSLLYSLEFTLMNYTLKVKKNSISEAILGITFLELSHMLMILLYLILRLRLNYLDL